ncbi:PREDICTED: RBPJ-interacting and tubulin-associated protein 1-like [Branchiostoma belcheri]|uniref:RBPJ-interacting and tubulin-associated protein 1 n=1 Tax=Branchiostoma belcheri TaxID=7741 RepID=A0A6P4YL48_BRABE|nr:PREDICTED: RBPJ-interacting and tubulin-associated protein 1-like [Branchiostoma belcheri]
MCGTMQDLTVTGQSKVSERGSSGKKTYKTTSNSSYVDEMLFGSPSDRRRSNENSFSTPKSKAPPLLWSPPVYGSKSDTAGSRSSRPPSGRLSGSSSRSESRRGNMPRTKNKYRLVKHTPTFVDEQLFGSRLSEPEFAAPWEEKDRRDTPLLWSPGTPTVDKITPAPTSGRRPNSRPSSALRERPGSRAGEQPLYYQSGVETRTGRYSSWSRPGSAASGRTSATGVRPRWNP